MRKLLTMSFSELRPKPRSPNTGRYTEAPPRLSSGIYILRNLKDGKLYVGSGVDVFSRRRSHYRALISNSHCNLHLQQAFRKYGASNFVFEVIEWTINNLYIREQVWIEKLNACNNKFGYNCGPAVGTQLGRKRNAAQRKAHRTRALKMWAEGKLRRKATKATRRKQSLSHMGHVRSLASRQKQSKTLKERYGNNR